MEGVWGLVQGVARPRLLWQFTSIPCWRKETVFIGSLFVPRCLGQSNLSGLTLTFRQSCVVFDVHFVLTVMFGSIFDSALTVMFA